MGPGPALSRGDCGPALGSRGESPQPSTACTRPGPWGWAGSGEARGGAVERSSELSRWKEAAVSRAFTFVNKLAPGAPWPEGGARAGSGAARRPGLELRTLQALGSRRPPPRPARPSRDTNGHWSKLRPARVPGEPCGGVSQGAGQRLQRSCSTWKWGGACRSSWGPSGARRLFLGWPVIPGQLWPGCLRPGVSQGCRHVPGRFPGVVCDGSGPPRAAGAWLAGIAPSPGGGCVGGQGRCKPSGDHGAV